MYKILLFSGGVYRFTDVVETVEDMGGLILRKDHFQISRGSSYLSDEIQVMLIVPGKDEKIVESISNDIMGRIEELDVDKHDKQTILSYISIYNALNQASSWLEIEEIEDLIECPCLSSLCENSDDQSCVINELEETLDKLCEQEILLKRYINGKTHYRLLDK